MGGNRTLTVESLQSRGSYFRGFIANQLEENVQRLERECRLSHRNRENDEHVCAGRARKVFLRVGG
jgi:hypothetical protein